MNPPVKVAVFGVALFISALLYVGADWQTEVCVFNINGGIETYGWICSLWLMTNWAAFDFWRLIRYMLVSGWVGFLIYYFVKVTLLENKIRNE